MAIIIECPSCAAKAQVGDNALGRSVRCPKCLNQYVVGAAPRNGGGIQTAAQPSPPMARVAPAVEPPRPVKSRNVLALVGLLSLPLAGLALVLSGVALGITLFRPKPPDPPNPPDPLGSGLSKYDFSTPRAALRSQDEVQVNRDIRAQLEYMEQIEGPKLKERLKTLEVKKEAQWGSKTILFISFEEEGVKKHQIASFEKHAKSGLWRRSFVGSYDTKLQQENKELADQMRAWESKGELTPPQQIVPKGPGRGPGLPNDINKKDQSGKLRGGGKKS
jgi:predicted Zn finger-like uncharacterized protein